MRASARSARSRGMLCAAFSRNFRATSSADRGLSGLPRLDITRFSYRLPSRSVTVTTAGIRAWQAGQALNASHWLPSSALWTLDSRLGIALEPGRNTVIDGQLYTSEAVALNEGIGFIARVQGADGVLPRTGILRFGGDGHAASLQSCTATLPAADGDEGVDRLDARLDRCVHALAGDDARGDALDRSRRGGGDGPLVVERPPERVDHPAHERSAHGDLDHGARGLDGVPLADGRVVAQDDRADRLLLEVEGHAHQPAGELEQLGRQRAGQPVDLGDAVTDLDHRPHAPGLGAGVERVDRGLDDAGDLVGTNGHRYQIS